MVTGVARVFLPLALILLSALSAWAAPSEVVCAGDGTRYALVIGNQDYRGTMQSLSNPVRDADSLKEILCANGFTVHRATDLDLNGFYGAIDNFIVASREAKTKLVYYSGHGFAAGRRNWLVPVDANLSCENVPRDGTPASRLSSKLIDLDEELLSRLKGEQIIILDACRTNPIHGCRGGDALTLEKGLGRASSDPRLILYATQNGEPALDAVAGSTNSPLMTAIVKQFPVNAQRNWVTTMSAVIDEVDRLTNHRQTPNLDLALPPRGCLAGKDCNGTGLALPPAENDATVWDRIKGSSDPKQLESFIALFPQSPYRVEAEARLQALASLTTTPMQLPSRPVPPRPTPHEDLPRPPELGKPYQDASLYQPPPNQAITPGSPTCKLEMEPYAIDAAGVGHFVVKDACGKLNPLTLEYEQGPFTIAATSPTRAEFTFDFFAGAKPLTVRTADGRAVTIQPPPLNQAGLAKAVLIWDGPYDLDLHAFENSAPAGSANEVSRANPRSLTEALALGGGYLSQAGATAISGTHVIVYTLHRSPVTKSVDFRVNLSNCSTAATVRFRMLRYQNGTRAKDPERQRVGPSSCGPFAGADIDNWAPRARALDLQIPF